MTCSAGTSPASSARGSTLVPPSPPSSVTVLSASPRQPMPVSGQQLPKFGRSLSVSVDAQFARMVLDGARAEAAAAAANAAPGPAKADDQKRRKKKKIRPKTAHEGRRSSERTSDSAHSNGSASASGGAGASAIAIGAGGPLSIDRTQLEAAVSASAADSGPLSSSRSKRGTRDSRGSKTHRERGTHVRRRSDDLDVAHSQLKAFRMLGISAEQMKRLKV